MNEIDIRNSIREKEEQIKAIQKEIAELNKKLSTINSNIETKSNLTLEQKIELYMSYFRGRDDVYPYLSIDKVKNVKYYIPACSNEWKKGVCNKTMGKKCKSCRYRENEPITYETIKNHLYNDKTIGMYPMLEDETCYLLAFDFDDKKDENHIKEDVLAFVKVCEDNNIDVAIERSRSGKGIHCWIFFKTKVKAITARKLGSLLLSKTMEIRDNLKIDSFDRMFPNQDYMPKGGYGNLIALPFQTEPAKYGNSIFIDKNFIKVNNQWEYLSSIRKLTEEEVILHIEELSGTTIDISHENYDLKKDIKSKRKNNFKFPKEIKVTLNDMIYIDKANLSASVKNSFRRLAMFANPQFYKNQKMRMPVYNIPMVIDCSKEDDKYLKLPRGTYEYLEILCKENNVKIKLKDIRNAGVPIEYKFNGNLREEQEKALQSIMKYETGILKAPTGFGKTVVCCKLIAERKTNVLVITEKLQLLRQWKERISEFLNIEVGQISGGKTTVTNKVDVASIKSIWNNGNFNDIVKNYGMIIIDECHHLAAYTYENAINTVNAKYVYGVTATPDRENGHTPIIKMQCGDIRYEVNVKEFNKNLQIPMKVYVKNTHLNFVDKNITDYTINEINNFIVKDIIRNEKIVKDIIAAYNNKNNILVLTERIEHLKYFEEKLSKITNNLFVYSGGIGKKILKRYDELNNKIKENNMNKIIIATGSYIGEGFDDSTLDVLFLTMPISGITKVTQYTGRLHRKNKDKKEIIVYDYVDDNFKQTRNMFKKRKKTYEKLGYEVINEENQVQYKMFN